MNELAGFHHAHENTLTELPPFQAFGNLDVAQPCDLDEWNLFNVSASYDPLGQGLVSTRWVPLTVTRRWTGPGTERKTIEITPEIETFGYPGIPVPVNRGGAAGWYASVVPLYFERYEQKIPDLGISLSALMAWNNYTLMGMTYNFGSPQTRYGYVRGQVVDVDVNRFSAYFTDPADPIEFGVLTYDNDTSSLTLYSATFTVVDGSDPDAILNPITFNALEVWASVNPNDTFRLNGRIRIDPVEADYWVVGWKHQAGVRIARSTDGGATFNSAELIGSGLTDNDFVENGLGLDLYDERLVIIAHDGTTDVEGRYNYSVYTASTKGGAISQLSNPTGWIAWPSSLALRSTSSAIVPFVRYEAPEPDNDLEAVTFDAGGYPDYVISGGGTTSGIGTSAFYPAQVNMAFGSQSGPGFGNSVFCNVTVDLDAFYTFNQVSFWRVYSIPWTLTNRRGSYTVTLLDSNDQVIASKSFPEESFSAASFTVTRAQLGIDADTQVWKVVVSTLNEWDSASGPSGTAVAFIDDIDVSAELVEYNTERALFTLNPSSGVYTERNSLQRLPFNAYGLGVDRQDANRVFCIGSDEDGNQPALLRSTTGGNAWLKVRDVPGLIGLKVSGEVVLLHGFNRLEVSADSGDTSFNMLGDWVVRVGPIGVIRGIAGVL